MIYNFWLYFDL